MDEPRRSIIREHQFEDELRALISDAERADWFVAAAEYSLSTNPHLGLQLAPDSRVWFLPMATIGDRQISLYYTFDGSKVSFLSIRAFDG